MCIGARSFMQGATTVARPAIVSLLLTTPLFAQEGEVTDLSLRDLLNLETTVASWKIERASDAPGAVTVYPARDIERFGVNTIQQLADITPGYSSSTEQGIYLLETRGGTSSLNEKHLVLIDGMPIQHARNGQARIAEEIPLQFMERIEFLRGPASALYGIGAFNGVINIVPKKLEKEGAVVTTKMQVGVESGTNDDIARKKTEILCHENDSGQSLFSRRFFGNAVVRKEIAETQFAYGHYSRENGMEMGYDYDNATGDYGIPHGPYLNGKVTHFGRLQTTLIDGPFRGAGLGFIGLYSWDNYGQGWHTKSNEGNYRIWSTYIPYVRYDKKLTNTMSLMAYTKMNYSREKGSQSNDAGWWAPAGQLGMLNFDVMTKNGEAYAKYDWKITEHLDMLAGIDFDVRRQDSAKTYVQNSMGPGNHSTKLFGKAAFTYSGFLQARAIAPVLNDLIVTAGLRSDNGTLDLESYNQLSPRAAMVLKITDGLNLKAMYGTALKAPGIDNISHNLEKRNQSDIKSVMDSLGFEIPTLKAEAIHTFEGNLTFANEKLYAAGTGFCATITNSLYREYRWQAVNSDFWFNRERNSYAAGGELELQYAPLHFLRFRINGSYTKTWTVDTTATGTDTVVHDAVVDIPAGKSNFGVNYTAPFGLNSYLAVKSIWALVRPGGWERYDAGYWLVDLNFRQPIGGHFTVELTIENLFNEQYFSFRRTIPMPNRIVSLSLSSDF